MEATVAEITMIAMRESPFVALAFLIFGAAYGLIVKLVPHILEPERK